MNEVWLSRQRSLAVALAAGVLTLAPACVTLDVDSVRKFASIAPKWGPGTGVEVRKHRASPLAQTLNLVGRGGPKPSERSLQFLRRQGLSESYQSNPDELLAQLNDQTDRRPNLEQLSALAELAYVQGEKSRYSGDEVRAGQMLAAAGMAAHQYLFDSRLDPYRNEYDPEFRKACDIYNSALEGMLRIMRDQEMLKPGGTFTASSLAGKPLQLTVSVEGRWKNEEFEKFEFVSDYRTEGLRNVYHTYGLGVPLIGIRAQRTDPRPGEEYYPPGLTLPLTAFVHVMPVSHMQSEQSEPKRHCVVQLFDPLETTEVLVAGHAAPLESDITTPLAYYLDDPLLSTNWFATAALINADFAKQFHGLYMLEPYDSQKIPVVMVHGLWSSPVTWTTMFNDLRADKRISDNFQFWFYLYPTGQPFWVSARQMRQDLAKARRVLDPDHESATLNDMVLVGHSMGGLVSRLQTIDSGDRFWNIVSSQSISDLKGDEEAIEELRDTLYFDANPSVSRVITLGTPHRGSNFANSATRWVGHKLFRLPSVLTKRYKEIAKANPTVFTNPKFLTIDTSIDSLSPESPFFVAMHEANSPRAIYHNVIGQQEASGLAKLFGLAPGPSDGVVPVDSATVDDAVSQITVRAEHTDVHQHPLAVLEIRRILLEHLSKTRDKRTIVPASFDSKQEKAPSRAANITWKAETGSR